MEIALIITFIITAVIGVLLIIREESEGKKLERAVEALAEKLSTEEVTDLPPSSASEGGFYRDISNYSDGETEVIFCEMLFDKLPFERLERAYLLILVHELDESNYPRLIQRLNQE
jgi:hypothetical protein